MTFEVGKWRIDPKRAFVFIYAWPDNWLTADLAAWVTRRFEGRWGTFVVQDQLCARNSVMHTAMQSSPELYDAFVFVDNDVRPTADSDAAFCLDADICACETDHHGDGAWRWPNAFHDSFWWTTRTALAKIEQPYFTPPVYNVGYTARTGCLCETFRSKALSAGLTIAHGGHAAHDQKRTWA